MITLICISTIVATVCGFLSPLWSTTCVYGVSTIGTGCASLNWLYATVTRVCPISAVWMAQVAEELGVTAFCPTGMIPKGPEIYEYPPGTFV